MTKGLQRAWTPKEFDLLARFCADRLGTARIARLLGRSAGSIDSKARALGIVRDPSKRKYAAQPEYRKPGASSPTPRRCMSCGTTFPSWGIGNRMCKRCKRLPTG